jgi:hypothetical protein
VSYRSHIRLAIDANCGWTNLCTSSSVAAKALQGKCHSSLIQRELDVLQLAGQEGGVTRTLLGGLTIKRESPDAPESDSDEAGRDQPDRGRRGRSQARHDSRLTPIAGAANLRLNRVLSPAGSFPRRNAASMRHGLLEAAQVTSLHRNDRTPCSELRWHPFVRMRSPSWFYRYPIDCDHVR